MSRQLSRLEFYNWTKCAIPDCQAGVCYRLQSKFCYPHSQRPQDKVIKQLDQITDGALVEEVQ